MSRGMWSLSIIPDITLDKGFFVRFKHVEGG